MAKVIIRMGQSNSFGNAAMATLQAEYQQTYSTIQTWGGSGFTSLNYAVNNNQHPSPANTFASEFALLSDLQAYFGETIYDIKYAVGGSYLGTSLSPSSNWNTATKGSYYYLAISTINNALAYMWNTLGIRSFDFYIFWDQGESDTHGTTDANNYQTNVTAFINALRANMSGTSLVNSKIIWVNPRVNQNITSPASTGTINGATNASPIVISTTAANGVLTGMTVNITGVTGNTAANGTFVATNVSATSFSIPVAGNGAYVSGGTLNSWTLSSTVNTAQSAAAAALNNAYTFDCDSYALADGLHYNATGYNDKGIAAADVIINNNL